MVWYDPRTWRREKPSRPTIPYEESELQRDIEAADPAIKESRERFERSELGRALSRGGGAAPTPSVEEVTPIPSAEEAKVEPAISEVIVVQPPTFKERVKTIYGRAYAGLIGLTPEQREEAFMEEQRKIQRGEIERPGVPGGRGTVIREFKGEPTREEAERIAKESVYDIGRRRGALLELQRREEEKYGKAYTFSVNSFAKELKQDAESEIKESQQTESQTLTNVQTDLQEKVNRGDVSVGEANTLLKQETDNANSRLETKVDSINKQNQEKVKKHGEEWIATSGKEMEKGSEKYLNKVAGQAALSVSIARIPVLIIVGAGLGAAGVAAPAVAVGVKVAAVGGLTYTGVSVLRNPKSLTKENIAAFAITAGSLAIGAYVGGAIVSSVKISNLNSAINRASIDVKSPRIITREAHVAKINIPKDSKATIKGYVRRGFTVRETRADIVPKNPKDAKIINKALPKRSIRFIEVLDQKGNVIQRIAIGKVTVAKGGKEFTQDIIARSEGVIKRGGEFETETLTLIGREGKPITKAIATKEIGKAVTIKAKDLRLTKAQLKILERGRITAKHGKPITKGQIEDLLIREAKLKAKGEFVQAGKKVIDIKELEAIGKDIYFKRGIAFIEKGRGKISPIEIVKKPSKILKELPKEIKAKIKYEKPISYKSLKEAAQAAEKDYPGIVQPDGKGVSLFQVDVKSAFYKPVSPGEIMFEQQFISTAGIKGALSEAGRVLSPVKAPILAPPIRMEQLMIKPEIQTKQLEKLRVETLQKLKLREIQTQKFIQTTTPISIQALMQQQQLKLAQVQQPKLKQKQIQQQMQALETYNPLEMIPPGFTWTPPSTLFGRGLDGARQQRALQSIFRQPGRKPGYAASLAAAAFQARPTKVTKKQLEKLKKQIYTGFEIRPVLELTSKKKQKKKKKKGVIF